MATLTWPEGILPSNFNWYLSSNGSVFTSPWNKQSQTIRFPGSSWEATVELNALDDLESREIEAIIVEMDGPAGRIKLWDMGRFNDTPKGNPVVNGAGQQGGVLSTSGWNANTLVMKRGDYLTVNNELKMVLADVTSNAQGVASIKIGPQLRNIPQNGSAVEVRRPYGIFRFADMKNGVKRSPAFNNAITLNLVEAI